MHNKGPEVVGGFVQTHDPSAYKLPPVADWVVKAVPGETPAEASPLLYAQDLADEEIRLALAAVGDTMVRSDDNGNGGIVSYDISMLNAETMDAVMKGVEKIRALKLPREVRAPVLEFLKTIKNQASGPEELPATAETTSQISAKTRKRQRLEREKQERQRRHEEAKEAEIELFERWQETHPLSNQNGMDITLSHLQTVPAPKGGIWVSEKEGYEEKLTERIRFLAANPPRVYDDFADAEIISKFIDENDVPILRELYDYTAEKGSNYFVNYTYENPQALRTAIPGWIEVFKNFPDEYKAQVRFADNSAYSMDPGTKDPKIIEHDKLNGTGIRILENSLLRLATTHPDDFLELAYDLAQEAVKSGDKFAINNTLYLIAGLLTKSATVGLIILNAPQAMDLDRTTKLKGMDLRMAMSHVGCDTDSWNKDFKSVPRGIKKKYFPSSNVLARQLGLDPFDPDLSQKIYEHFSAPLAQSINAGLIMDSLVRQLRRLK